MLQWALGRRVSVVEDSSDPNIGCLFVSTDIEHYENDTRLFEHLGFDIIGKIRGVIRWEVIDLGPQEQQQREEERLKQLEAELMQKLSTLPITISIMARMEGTYAWKCLEASGYADSFSEALEAALTHLTHLFKLMRSELLG